MSDYPAKFDIVAILDHFGGSDAFHMALLSVGCNIQRKTVNKWKQRGNIPSGVIASLCLYGVRGGERFPVEKFLLERDE